MEPAQISAGEHEELVQIAAPKWTPCTSRFRLRYACCCRHGGRHSLRKDRPESEAYVLSAGLIVAPSGANNARDQRHRHLRSGARPITFTSPSFRSAHRTVLFRGAYRSTRPHHRGLDASCVNATGRAKRRCTRSRWSTPRAFDREVPVPAPPPVGIAAAVHHRPEFVDLLHDAPCHGADGTSSPPMRRA